MLNEIIKFLEDDLESSLNEFYHISAYSSYATENKYVLKYALPGAEKEDISLVIEGELISLDVKGSDTRMRFKDKLWCPDDVSIDTVTAKYKNGILEIMMPRMVKKDKHIIEIE